MHIARGSYSKAGNLLGRQEVISLFVRSSLAEKFQDAAGQSWPIETIAT
jgi:hypothetical protein